MNEWWAGMALIAGGLGVLIILAWLLDYAGKETIRELRDICHKKDEDKDEGQEQPRRRVRRMRNDK